MSGDGSKYEEEDQMSKGKSSAEEMKKPTRDRNMVID